MFNIYNRDIAALADRAVGVWPARLPTLFFNRRLTACLEQTRSGGAPRGGGSVVGPSRVDAAVPRCGANAPFLAVCSNSPAGLADNSASSGGPRQRAGLRASSEVSVALTVSHRYDAGSTT